MRLRAVLPAVLALFAVTAGTINSEETEIAYVDIEYIYENSALQKKLADEYHSRREALMKIRSQAARNVEKLQALLKRRTHLLSYDEYTAEVELINRKIEEAEKRSAEAAEELKQWESDIMATVYDDILLALETVAAEENIRLILSKKQAVVYSETALDISQNVIDLLNESDARLSPTAR